ncbi:MAG: hypothetical protein R2854_03305 [Caldilineaceae bacterium]
MEREQDTKMGNRPEGSMGEKELSRESDASGQIENEVAHRSCEDCSQHRSQEATAKQKPRAPSAGEIMRKGKDVAKPKNRTRRLGIL